MTKKQCKECNEHFETTKTLLLDHETCPDCVDHDFLVLCAENETTNSKKVLLAWDRQHSKLLSSDDHKKIRQELIEFRLCTSETISEYVHTERNEKYDNIYKHIQAWMFDTKLNKITEELTNDRRKEKSRQTKRQQEQSTTYQH